MTQMKSLKKIHVQTYDSGSDADEGFVAFTESGGWSKEQV